MYTHTMHPHTFCDISKYSSTTSSSEKDLYSSPQGTNHKSLNSSATTATVEFLLDHPSYGHVLARVIITHTACYCTAYTNLATPVLAGWLDCMATSGVCLLSCHSSFTSSLCVYVCFCMCYLQIQKQLNHQNTVSCS